MKKHLKELSNQEITELKNKNTYAMLNTRNNVLSLSVNEMTFAQIDCTGYTEKEIKEAFGYFGKYSSKY